MFTTIMNNHCKYLLHSMYIFIVSSLLINKAYSIHCFECDSSVDMTCGETLAVGHTLLPNDCTHLQEPAYCVKMTGLYEASSIYCYQCDSTKDTFCPETISQIQRDAGYTQFWEAKPCGNVYNAQYCVKTTGLFAGELGTKRFCSARDFGNYCEMVRRPGDERLYRACVYTCGTHSCNSSMNIQKPHSLALALCILVGLLQFFLGIDG